MHTLHLTESSSCAGQALPTALPCHAYAASGKPSKGRLLREDSVHLFWDPSCVPSKIQVTEETGDPLLLKRNSFLGRESWLASWVLCEPQWLVEALRY